MNFKKWEIITEEGDNQVTSGVCDIDGHETRCVQKEYSLKDFEQLKNTMESYTNLLKHVGPHIFFIDNGNNKVYMEYLQCQTVQEYLESIDIENDRESLALLFKSIINLLIFMENEKFQHNDLHLRNVLRCNDGSLKIIDIDTSGELENVFEDRQMIFESIRSYIKSKFQQEHNRRVKNMDSILKESLPGDFSQFLLSASEKRDLANRERVRLKKEKELKKLEIVR